MVDFQVVSRSNGRNTVKPYEKVALKDVAVLGPKEQVTIAIKFAPFAGLYMFHCHNAIHEDHAMMDAFNITEVLGLGYNASDLDFADPMEPQWGARSYTDAQAQSILGYVLPRFAATDAYQNVSIDGVQSSDKASNSLSTQFEWLTLLGGLFFALL